MSRKPIEVEPSLLAADFSKIGEEARRCVDAGADALHLDVMDGHFVRNLSMGPAMVAAVNRSTEAFLDVHLMAYSPFDYIEPFVEAGADSITIHFEATEDVSDTLAFIRRCNVKAGLAFCPETSASLIPKYLDQCDRVLLMTVRPGFGGQAFMPEVLEKIAFVRNLCDQQGIHHPGTEDPFTIQVDGGITQETAEQCYEAGANNLVVGTYLFKQAELQTAIANLHAVSEK